VHPKYPVEVVVLLQQQPTEWDGRKRSLLAWFLHGSTSRKHGCHNGGCLIGLVGLFFGFIIVLVLFERLS
jgi:hypothetical protein